MRRKFRPGRRFCIAFFEKGSGIHRRDPMTLALGIGVNVAIFAIVNGILLNPLPFLNPKSLCLVFEKTPSSQRSSVSYPNFLDWQRGAHSFTSLAAFRADNFVLTGRGQPERLHGGMISAGFLETLGVKPVLGREFSEAEDQLGSGGVVLIGENFWRNRLGARSDVLGITLRLDGVAYAVVGVVPQAIEALKLPLFSPGDVYVPLGQWRDPSFRDRKVTTGMLVVGRLAQAVTEKTASAEMSKIAADLAAAYSDANRNVGINVLSLSEVIVAGIRPMLLVLVLTVGLVLLIACTNVANLQLTRFSARMREFATRAALGASPSRLIVQLLTESLLLGLVGGALGLLLAIGVMRSTLALASAEIPRSNLIGIDMSVCIFAVGISAISGVLFGLLPALRIRLLKISAALKEGSHGSSTGRYRAQNIFVVVEVALALALLVGSSLMLRSLMNLWHARPGFDANNALVFEITPSPETAADAQKIRVLFRNLADRIEELPGVESASVLLDPLPLTGVADIVPFDIEGRASKTSEKQKTSAIWYFVGPDYFRSMGIALKEGRPFRVTDNENTPQVAIIDEAFAQSVFPDESPLGKRITIGYTGASEIIGVARHVNHWNLGGDLAGQVSRQMYFPYSQLMDKYLPIGIKGGATVVVRTRAEPHGVLPQIQTLAGQLDSGLVLFDVHTIKDSIASWLATRRFMTILLSIFAGLALMLATVGIYGVISYVSAQRTQEIGIRMSLGARREDVLRLILFDGAKLALIGIAAGLLGALGIGRTMHGFLYGVSMIDPAELFCAAAVLILVSVLACFIPARRASLVDPLLSLRSE